MKNNKLLILIGLLLIVVGVCLLNTTYRLYSIIPAVLLVIVILKVIESFVLPKDDNSVYERTLKSIIRDNYSILAELNQMPNMDDKEILHLNSMDDLLNVQEQLQKPIYFMRNTKSTTFMVVEDKCVSLYNLRIKQ